MNRPEEENNSFSIFFMYKNVTKLAIGPDVSYC